MNLTVVDYGMGNIFSVVKALSHVGASVTLVNTPAGLSNTTKLVIPGVGAFPTAIEKLKQRSLFEPLRELILSGVPTLGLCVGMQLLFESSEEFGFHNGMGILSGAISRIPDPAPNEAAQWKVPHVGWNKISFKTNPEKNSIFSGLDGEYVYFVHSYAQLNPFWDSAATFTQFNNTEFVSAVSKKNLFGCQFHPEKSGEVGLQILKNFIKF